VPEYASAHACSLSSIPRCHAGEQQPGQPGFALAERPGPEILAVQLDQVEGEQDRVARLTGTAERIEDGNPIGTAELRLKVFVARSPAGRGAASERTPARLNPCYACRDAECREMAATVSAKSELV
jgi:hypothetical protein